MTWIVPLLFQILPLMSNHQPHLGNKISQLELDMIEAAPARSNGMLVAISLDASEGHSGRDQSSVHARLVARVGRCQQVEYPREKSHRRSSPGHGWSGLDRSESFALHHIAVRRRSSPYSREIFVSFVVRIE
jgi:hypothetical protein